jgi:hypothetical protein
MQLRIDAHQDTQPNLIRQAFDKWKLRELSFAPTKSKKRKTRPIVIYTPDRKDIRFTDPQSECLGAIAKGYNRKHGTRLHAAQAPVRILEEIFNHPVKSLRLGSVAEQGQLDPNDRLPVPVQFANSSPA